MSTSNLVRGPIARSTFPKKLLAPLFILFVCAGILSSGMLFGRAFAAESAGQAPLQAQSEALVVESSDIASGTWGTCDWEISSTGALTIHPGTGLSGNVPWSSHRSYITSVVAVAESGKKIVCPQNCAELFQLCNNLVSVNLSGFDVSAVTNISNMFSGCSSLASANLNSWNTAKVTNMSYLFWCCTALKSVSIGSWNTANTMNMRGMFGGCESLASLGISAFKTSSVTDFGSMFSSCSSLKALDLSGWTTRSDANYQDMFLGCGPLSQFKVGKGFVFSNAYDCTFPTSAASDCMWFSSADYKWYSNETIVAKRSGKADTYVSDLAALAPISMGKLTISVSPRTFKYNGKKRLPAVTVKLGDKTLKLGTDYRVVYRNCIEPGTATCTVYGKGNFDGSRAFTYTIVKPSITSMNISKVKTQIYKGKAIQPTPKVTYDGSTLKRGTDYTITYKNNKKAGSAKIIITGKGHYKGKKTITFKIAAGSIANAKVSKTGPFTYTGKAITPKPSVTVSGVSLQRGKDYTLSYSSNVNAGTATVNIVGKGNYIGSQSVEFKINPANLKKASIGVIVKKTYTGAAIKPMPKVKFGKKTLVYGTDYTLSYASNVNVGTATVVVTGTGNYTGTAKVGFDIVKGANPMTVRAKATTLYAQWLASKSYTLAPITVQKAVGKVTYAQVGTSKVLKLDASTGKVIVPKSTKEGTYTMSVKVSAAGNDMCKAKSVTVKVKVVVKKQVISENESEPNDDYDNADEITIGNVMKGSVDYLDDDWFTVNASAAATYKVTLANLKGIDSDGYLEIHVYSGTFEDEDNYPPYKIWRVDVSAAKSASATVDLAKGTNYIKVWGHGFSGNQPYSVLVEKA